MIIESVLLGLSRLLVIEYASPHVVWNTMFMLWHVSLNSKDLASSPYSSTWMNENFLSRFLGCQEVNVCFLIEIKKGMKYKNI